MHGVREKKDMCDYRAVVHREDGGYWAEVPALPGCYAMGATMDELRANLVDAVHAHIAALNRFPVPEGARCVRVGV